MNYLRYTANDKLAMGVPAWMQDPNLLTQAGIGAGVGGLAGAGLGYGLGGGTGALLGGLAGAGLGGVAGGLNAYYDPFQLGALMGGQGNIYIAQGGEVWSDLSLATGVPEADLIAANPGIVSVPLAAGQQVIIPDVVKQSAYRALYLDKLANAEAALGDAAAEQAIMQEAAMGEKIEEDLAIAEEVLASDLPMETKVEILESEGVEPEIIDEVVGVMLEEAQQIQAALEADAVASYYGMNPYWFDKTAAEFKPNALQRFHLKHPYIATGLGGLAGAGLGAGIGALYNKFTGLDIGYPLSAGSGALGGAVGTGIGITLLKHKQRQAEQALAEQAALEQAALEQAEADAVASYYGMNPYWFDKTAAGVLPAQYYAVSPTEVEAARMIGAKEGILPGAAVGGLGGAGLGYYLGDVPGALIGGGIGMLGGGAAGYGLGGALNVSKYNKLREMALAEMEAQYAALPDWQKKLYR